MCLREPLSSNGQFRLSRVMPHYLRCRLSLLCNMISQVFCFVLNLWNTPTLRTYIQNQCEVMTRLFQLKCSKTKHWYSSYSLSTIFVSSQHVRHVLLKAQDEEPLLASSLQVILLPNCLPYASVSAKIGEGLLFIRRTQQWLNYYSSASPSFWLDSFFRPVSK
jgi:hypothetical protein